MNNPHFKDIPRGRDRGFTTDRLLTPDSIGNSSLDDESSESTSDDDSMEGGPSESFAGGSDGPIQAKSDAEIAAELQRVEDLVMQLTALSEKPDWDALLVRGSAFGLPVQGFDDEIAMALQAQEYGSSENTPFVRFTIDTQELPPRESSSHDTLVTYGALGSRAARYYRSDRTDINVNWEPATRSSWWAGVLEDPLALYSDGDAREDAEAAASDDDQASSEHDSRSDADSFTVPPEIVLANDGGVTGPYHGAGAGNTHSLSDEPDEADLPPSWSSDATIASLMQEEEYDVVSYDEANYSSGGSSPVLAPQLPPEAQEVSFARNDIYLTSSTYHAGTATAGTNLSSQLSPQGQNGAATYSDGECADVDCGTVPQTSQHKDEAL
ncbi:hypothetical protein HK405_008250 [Cladochytrium tenue]|nr:hypothetical protein HK405_008250 [Cladochytrium tenue]